MKKYFNGTFKNTKADIGNWVASRAAESPDTKIFMAGPNAGKGKDLSYAGIEYDNSINENIVARITPKGVMIHALIDSENYPFEDAAYKAGMGRFTSEEFAAKAGRRQVVL